MKVEYKPVHIFVEGRFERNMKPVDERCLMFNCGHLGKGNRGSQVLPNNHNTTFSFKMYLVSLFTCCVYVNNLQEISEA